MTNLTDARSSKQLSRRGVLAGGVIAGLSGALGLSALNAQPLLALPGTKKGANHNATSDIKILNTALYYENQAIWAYGVAASKLSDTAVGKAVLALGLANQADHKTHRDTLASVIKSLGGMPVMAEAQYDLSSYIQRGEGNLDSDVNIAKLALALEVDAAIAYGIEASKLKTPQLVTAGASIATVESAHATAIRAAFISLGVDIKTVPAAFMNADTRTQWILKV
jgi:rubrerythrin